EDGIRDRTVTGVQTCALPILQPDGRWPSTSSPATSTPWRAPELGPLHRLDVEVDREQVLHVEGVNGEARVYEVLVLLDPHAVVRSEERRVGKECRTRGAAVCG